MKKWTLLTPLGIKHRIFWLPVIRKVLGSMLRITTSYSSYSRFYITDDHRAFYVNFSHLKNSVFPRWITLARGCFWLLGALAGLFLDLFLGICPKRSSKYIDFILCLKPQGYLYIPFQGPYFKVPSTRTRTCFVGSLEKRFGVIGGEDVGHIPLSLSLHNMCKLIFSSFQGPPFKINYYFTKCNTIFK